MLLPSCETVIRTYHSKISFYLLCRISGSSVVRAQLLELECFVTLGKSLNLSMPQFSDM